MPAAMFWYSKASAGGNQLASMYIGMIHHFGIHGAEQNTVRAIRYV